MAEIDLELSGHPNPPWRSDSERSPQEIQTPPAKAKERTVFGLARDLKTLVREDRAQRSEHARRFHRAEKSH